MAWLAAARRRTIRRPVQWDDVRRRFFSDALTGPVGFVTDHMFRQNAVILAIVALASEYGFGAATRIEYAPYIAQATTGRSNDILDRSRILRTFKCPHDRLAVALEHRKKFADYLDHAHTLRECHRLSADDPSCTSVRAKLTAPGAGNLKQPGVTPDFPLKIALRFKPNSYDLCRSRVPSCRSPFHL
jgi:hypothetical protein